MAKNKKEKAKETNVALPTPIITRELPSPLDPLHHYLTEIGKIPLLTQEEEEKLAKYYAAHHDKESAQKLIISNLRLVVKIAMEYRRAFYNFLDLIQEGNVGLVKAVSKYDLSKGTRFAYYASWWIRAYILKYIIDNFRLVKIGTTQGQKKLFYNLMKEKRRMEAMGFSPKTHLLSKKLDVKEKEVVEMEQRMGAADLSLDAPSPHFEGKFNIDFFANNETSPETKAEEEELKEKLFSHLKEFTGTLKEKEFKIFQQRLYAELPKTLQEIANEYGITRERVRQIEERVVKKLRKFFKGKGFEVDMNTAS